MRYVGQKALLAAKKAIQPFQRLVKGSRQFAGLVGAVTVGHASAQVVGAGDLAGDGGNILQRPEQGGGHHRQDDEGGDGRPQADQQRPAQHAVEDLEIVEQPRDLDVADELLLAVVDRHRQHAQQCILVRYQSIDLLRAQIIRIEQVVEAGQVARLDDNRSLPVDDDQESRSCF